MDEFAQKYFDSIFAFGFGYMLLNLPEVPTWAAWVIGLLVISFALFSLLQFANQARFWGTVQRDPAPFGPDGRHHDAGTFMFDTAARLVGHYQDRLVFWISLGSSVTLLAGLMKHQLYIPFMFEFTASVMGYSFIKAFLKNYHIYYGILNGTENNV